MLIRYKKVKLKKIFFNNYCKSFFFFLQKLKNILPFKNGFVILKRMIKVKKKNIRRRGKIFKGWNFFFFSDLYNLYFFFLWRNRKYQSNYLNLIKSRFFLVEVKSSLNNLFINLFVINKGERKLIYYISSGMKFKNNLKSVIFASIRLSDILMGYVRYKKIKNIIVFIYSLEYKILKFFKLFGSYKNVKNFNILYFLVKLNFVFNGVRLKRRVRK